MDKQLINNYIKNNIFLIRRFLMQILNITQKDADNIVEVVKKCVERDDFYKNVTLNDVDRIFQRDSILTIEKYLLSFGLSFEQVKEIIIQTPEILFYVDRLQDTYLIYQSGEFKGYVLLDGEKYKAYRILEKKDPEIEDEEDELIGDWRIENIPEYLHVVDDHSYQKMLEKAIIQLKTRPDLRALYGISENATTRELLDALTTAYSHKDLYLKNNVPKK